MKNGLRGALQNLLSQSVIQSDKNLSDMVRGILDAYTADTNTISGSGNITVNLNGSNLILLNLTGNATLDFSGQQEGVTILKIKQSSGGSNTVTWPSNVVWAGGSAPTLTTTANRSDVVTLIWDGSNFLATSTLNFNA